MPFCPSLYTESAVVQYLQAASSSCHPMLDLLVFWGGRGGSSQKGRARARDSSCRGRPVVPVSEPAQPSEPTTSGRHGDCSACRSASRKGRHPFCTWMVSLDLRDAYWHVLIHPCFRNWLGFVCVVRQAYRFRCLPFGLNLAHPSVTCLN